MQQSGSAEPASDQPRPTDAVAGPGLAPATRVLITLAAAVVVIAGFSLGREIIGPFALAAVIVLLVHPLRGVVRRRGAPSGLATLTVIVVAYLILAAMIALLLLAGQQFVALLTSSSDRISALATNVQSFASDLGIDTAGIVGTDGILNPSALVSGAQSILGSVTGVASAFFFILAYVIFMAIDSARFDSIPASVARPRTATISWFTDFGHGVRMYFGVNAIFGFIVAVLDGVLLLALQVPGALIWTILAFVTNFIPNIGFVIGLIPAAIFALLFGGWVIALVVIAAYIVINVVLQTLVQPKFVSDAVHLSLTLTFASVIFWTFVIGPLGALLAVPLTLFLRELLIGTDRSAGFSRWLTGGTP